MTAIPVSSAQAVPATHFAPEVAGLSAAQEISLAKAAQLQLLEERYLAYLGQGVSVLEARATLLGTPSTLTPRQAGKFRAALAATSFVQHRLAALAASDTLTADDLATVASLRNRAEAVSAELRSALGAATIVHPDAAMFRQASLVKPALLTDRDTDGDGKVCDGDHDGFRSSFRQGDGDHDGDHHDGDHHDGDHHDGFHG